MKVQASIICIVSTVECYSKWQSELLYSMQSPIANYTIPIASCPMRRGPSNSNPSACEKLPKRHTTKNFWRWTPARRVALRAIHITRKTFLFFLDIECGGGKYYAQCAPRGGGRPGNEARYGHTHTKVEYIQDHRMDVLRKHPLAFHIFGEFFSQKR